MSRTLAMILAGGEGTRLCPLTHPRTKPAVPFAGSFRLVDFVLNNFVNSEILKIYLLTQFKSQSLNTHLRRAWHFSGLTPNFIDAIPAQMTKGAHWYEGTADAIFQNLEHIEPLNPDHVCVFGSDHIYKMDVRQMLDFHKAQKAALTICATCVPIEQAHRFGVIQVDDNWQMIGFDEKPKNPEPLPTNTNLALVSMGNYIFERSVLFDTIRRDAQNPESSHDFGRDIIPQLYDSQPVYVYNFCSNKIAGESQHHYWRDVGTLDSFWEAHMDLLGPRPKLDLLNANWPLRSYHPAVPAAQFSCLPGGQESRVCNSIVSSGCKVMGAKVESSVLGFEVTVHPNAQLNQCVILGNASIGEGCYLNKVIADKGVMIAPRTEIGVNPEQDIARGLTVTSGGVVVIHKDKKVGFE